jgi:predicted molibdopterin-dependent oxidoreductase YjgC
LSVTENFEITFDGTPVMVAAGDTVQDVAERLGVEIPTLCHDKRLEPTGACRMCLIEVSTQRRMQPACAFKVTEGLEVITASERVQRHRRNLLSLYLCDTPLDVDGLPTERGPVNQVRDHVGMYGVGPTLPPIHAQREGREDRNPYIHFDPDSCISCARCVRYCDEVEGVSAITLAGRGASTTIATVDQVSLMDSSCELCGGCIDVCPTGAMSEKKSLGLSIIEEERVRTTCNFCGVGCQMDLHVRDGKVVRVSSPPPGTTLNDGNLCVKGRFSYEFINHEDRLTTPLIRGADGELHPATWEEAIRAAADGLMGVKKRHGADALGFISSSRCTGEENYLVQKLSRAAFGTNNCHQCAAT